MGQVDEENSDKVQEMRVASSMFTNTSSNDLKSLKKYFETDGKEVNTYAKAIEYTYNLSPQIYTNFNGKVRQVNPDQTFSAMGFSTSTSNSMMSFMTSTDLFYTLPREESLYQEQYDIKAGRWPEKYNELVLVVSPLGKVNDLTLYAMGLKDSDELDAMIDAFSRNEDVSEDESPLGVYEYEDFIGITFKLINTSDCYVYDSNYNVYTDKSQDEAFMKKLVDNGENLTIVGVVRQKEDANAAMLERGLHYRAELLDHVLENSVASELVQKQLVSEEVNVITNKKFGEEDDGNDFDMTSLFTIDEDAMEKAFSFDTSALNVDFSSMDMSNLDFGSLLNPSDLQLSNPDLDFGSLLSSIKFNIAQEDMQELFSTLLNGYLEYSAKDPSTDYQKLPESLQKYLETEEAKSLLLKDVQDIWNASAVSAITQEDVTIIIGQAFSGFQTYAEENNFDDASKLNEYIQAYLAKEEFQNLANGAVDDLVQKIMTTTLTQEDVEKMTNDLLGSYTTFANENAYPDLTKLSDSFASYMGQENTRQILMDGVTKAVDTTELETKVTEMIGSYSKTMTEQITKMITNAMTSFAKMISDNIQGAMEKAFANIGNAFSFDANTFTNAIHVEMNEEELSELFASLMSKDRSSYESTLRRLGYADLENPSMITIYPKDFEGKTQIKDILNVYNEKMQENGEEEKIINYTDIVGTMMASVTDIINAISYVLVAFVAISLVVSSIMIGVITYISVLERKKEIGILRAIGASKRNISEVFNAETFIIGILAGLFGVIISLLLLIPGNQIIHSLTGHTDITAALPFAAGVALVTLSVILTLIGGIIPSRKAAKSDPVEALRTE
ncbi:MAG: ABC transporter permease [Solobacterium sp.]|nr:ABC transporter permease [Solobacterium sp.]